MHLLVFLNSFPLQPLVCLLFVVRVRGSSSPFLLGFPVLVRFRHVHFGSSHNDGNVQLCNFSLSAFVKSGCRGWWREVVTGGDGRKRGGEVVVGNNGAGWLQKVVARSGGVML